MASILVVEDNLTTLNTYASVLRSAGHDVALAATAGLGLAEARARRHDLGLVDLMLPDATAVYFLESLRSSLTSLPVIVVTGISSVETAVEVMRQGAVDYAVKPLFPDDLLAKVEWGLRAATTFTKSAIPPEAHAHSATRWAAMVVSMLEAPTDVRTNSEWARRVGVSTTTLRDWCRLTGTSAGRSLALARVLRAVHLSRGAAWIPSQRLHVSDPRTLARLLERSGLTGRRSSVSVRDVLLSQSLVDDPDALFALRDALKRLCAW